MKGARLQLRIDARLKRLAEDVARRRGFSLSALVARLLEREVEADLIAQRTSGPGSATEVESV